MIIVPANTHTIMINVSFRKETIGESEHRKAGLVLSRRANKSNQQLPLLIFLIFSTYPFFSMLYYINPTYLLATATLVLQNHMSKTRSFVGFSELSINNLTSAKFYYICTKHTIGRPVILVWFCLSVFFVIAFFPTAYFRPSSR